MLLKYNQMFAYYLLMFLSSNSGVYLSLQVNMNLLRLKFQKLVD